MDGARALLLVHDHHAAQDLTPMSRATRLVAARGPEAESYLRFMRDHAWRQVDFTRFSRSRNPAAREADLSLQSLASF